MIIVAALLIGVVMMATVADLGVIPGMNFSFGTPGEVRDQARQSAEGVIENLEDGWQRFRSAGYAFRIDFPQQVSRKSVLNQKALNAGFNLEPETPVWEFKLRDPQFYEDTNLIKASLVVHVLRGEEDVQSCSQFKARSKSLSKEDAAGSPPTVEINGVPFWVDETQEGVMGEMYSMITYRAVRNGACYQLTQLIHTRNIDYYEPGTVKEMDREAVVARLDEVLHTFHFLDVDPTFPKVAYPQPKAISQPVSKVKDDHVYGLDVSHWQSDINWPKVVDAGYVFTFVKATEGVGWLDVKFIENITEGTEAGELMGAYHFARPDRNTSGKEEAEYFLSEAGDYLESGYIRPVLDLEVGKELTRSEMTTWVMDWMETVETRSGVQPLLYTNMYYINHYLTDEVTKYDLWIAYWSCEPEPTFDIPPTGRWADWSFWQYYGPGGCGYNAGYVPGIETNIDLNIFNGVESGLLEYDAASPLWVSVTSDVYLAPYPYHADITANVNGDTTGDINYHFWWDCAALEADAAAVEESCGELPSPDPGSCQGNEHGMRCLGMKDEIQVGEHVYPELGDYTAKVIVERGDAQPAEDRYKIIVYNPLRYTTMRPASPATGYIDRPFVTKAKVRIHTSVAGAVQVSLTDQASGEAIGEICKPVEGDVKKVMPFEFSWSNPKVGKKQYTVDTRHRVRGSCPIEDSHEDDLSQTYVVDWQEPPPVLEIERPGGTILPEGGVDDAGNRVIERTIQLEYVLDNPNPYSSINIQDITLENPVNVSDLQTDFSGPVEIPAEGTTSVPVSFRVDEIAPFSFDALVEHDAANTSPYTFSVQGSGVLMPDPVQSLNVDPASPASALIGKSFPLHVELGVETPGAGVLQASVVDPDTQDIEARACRSIAGGVQGSEGFDLSWSEAGSGMEEYTVWARYREGGSCPITDSGDTDLSRPYQVDWQEDPAVLELHDAGGTSLPPGSVEDLGELDFYSNVELQYVLRNPSKTSSLQVSSIAARNLEGVADVQVTPGGPFEIGAEGKKTISVSFLVERTGSLGFDLALKHDASNPSPYEISLQGSGVMASEPIQSMALSPASSEETFIGQAFSLNAEVGLEITAAGALQVLAIDTSSGDVKDAFCKPVSEGFQGAKSFGLSWTESAPGNYAYSVRARYQAGGSCPFQGSHHDLKARSYEVTWVEDTPVLEVQRPSDNALPAGSVDAIGEYEFYQDLELVYTLHNPSKTSSLGIDAVRAESLSHLSRVDLSPSGPLSLGPGESTVVKVSFRVEEEGEFSFDLALDHDGGNPSPYTLTVEGRGVLAGDLIQFITPDPLPPGSQLISDPFQMSVDVGVDVPGQGALGVQMVEVGSGQVAAEACRDIGSALQDTKTFDLQWARSTPGSVNYTLRARYQAGGSCPISGTVDAQRTQEYRVEWREISPTLEVLDSGGTVIPEGSSDPAGESVFGESQQRTYVLHNPSPTTGMKVRSISTASGVNLSKLEVQPAGPVTIGPGEKVKVTLSYAAETLGGYSFDLVVDHDGSNSSPFQFTVEGQSVLSDNPIRSLTPEPSSPGSAWIGERFTVNVKAVVEAPADSALLVNVIDKESGEIRGGQCMNIKGQGRAEGTLELFWTETAPGVKDYTLQARYEVHGECPLGDGQDAVLKENYRVRWKEEAPVLEVKRPEGVTIFDGSMDNIGVHDWLNFVKVEYVLENKSRTTPLVIEDMSAEKLFNLKRVTLQPSGPFEMGPGERKTVKVVFLVLDLDPYTFDLVVEHDGENPRPYRFTVQGEANLNLRQYNTDPKVTRVVERWIERGLFMQVPDFVLDILESYLE